MDTWRATRCLSSEQTEPSGKIRTHHHTSHDFPDKQIKHGDFAATVRRRRSGGGGRGIIIIIIIIIVVVIII
jgi:t-SNARE complex subunit (syntaxin)